jgi:hypothetical protein
MSLKIAASLAAFAPRLRPSSANRARIPASSGPLVSRRSSVLMFRTRNDHSTFPTSCASATSDRSALNRRFTVLLARPRPTRWLR